MKTRKVEDYPSYYFQAGWVAWNNGRRRNDHEYTPGNYPAEEFCKGWDYAETYPIKPLPFLDIKLSLNALTSIPDTSNSHWLPWDGSEWQGRITDKVQVKMRDGITERVRTAGYWMRSDDDRSYWQHEISDHNNDIVFFRRVTLNALATQPKGDA